MPVNEISKNHKLTEAPMVGDHLAMDLLNTEARSGDKVIDYWNSDADVLRWLQLHGIVPVTGRNLLAAGELLKQAKALRALAHQVISSFKQQNRSDISELNLYLHTYVSAPHLQQDSDGKLLITRISRSEPAGAMLGPVAEAVAQLLAEGSASLVKQCEHPDCILWFYDRTKAHKRRWCSMATCGNRYKAAQFRKKQ
ncbi:putative RNA-binding Zn ribbon-like protein [Rheinheimera pacifica]|uniref:CGNR zinc finger domain-containing protein n=1 Tax=Rheinheimera pacifica TaxID=173990 RepID=UPI002167CC59|nr:ABATE domain-containing protein [Rheinheimera pacifica]MCS4308464.1 putative RNA-binding Zn ribbon-like protein [Rheinheimera pacifica]